MGALIPLLGSIATQVANSLFPSEEDKNKRKELEQAIQSQVLANSSAIDKAARDIIVAEAQSESWLARSWRPIVMLGFFGLLALYWVGLVPADHIPEGILDELFTLLQIGLGGYVVGRSAEKVADKVAPALGNGKDKPVDGMPWMK